MCRMRLSQKSVECCTEDSRSDRVAWSLGPLPPAHSLRTIVALPRFIRQTGSSSAGGVVGRPRPDLAIAAPDPALPSHSFAHPGRSHSLPRILPRILVAGWVRSQAPAARRDAVDTAGTAARWKAGTRQGRTDHRSHIACPNHAGCRGRTVVEDIAGCARKRDAHERVNLCERRRVAERRVPPSSTC
jgi:hypothetical protein